MLIIHGGSFHLSSAYTNVKNYVAVPNCLIIASRLYKSCVRYAGVLMTELVNENSFYLAAHLSVPPLKLILTVPAASVLGLILCTEEFIDELSRVAHIQIKQKLYNLHLMESVD